MKFRRILMGGADLGGQEDVAQTVDVELLEVILGKVKLESAFEVPDASF
jgi:hypothetical protein